FIDKQMIRLIMWITKGPTNITGSYEFTDWDKVDSFAKNVIK
ncbi:MAG: menaquinone-dependent protoporphyrinogen IX dehydrogenase, partial [Proteobacteria bacterium]|nr:menaquinone-dependent protoporphyrinogen IX dehydrogenase [Pseudomonadota bacterium]